METVFEQLQEWVNKPLAKLPLELRLTAKAFIPQWEKLTPKERTAGAIEHDRQRALHLELQNDRVVMKQDAALDEAERKHWFELVRQIDDKKTETAKWEDLPEPLPSEAHLKAEKLITLRAELAALEAQFKAPYSASTHEAPEIERANKEIALIAKCTAPPMVAGSASAGMNWTLIKPQRFQGYGKPLYDLLKAAHIAGQPSPKARDVVDKWKENPPPDVATVTDNGLKYYDAKGNTKPADLEAIRKAIDRMIQ